MPQRFDYARPTPRDLADKLAALDMLPKAFARVFGVRADTAAEWLKGERQIPPWVHVALAVLELPGAMPTARHAAAEMIVRDNLRPELGEYPYLNREAVE